MGNAHSKEISLGLVHVTLYYRSVLVSRRNNSFKYLLRNPSRPKPKMKNGMKTTNSVYLAQKLDKIL